METVIKAGNGYFRVAELYHVYSDLYFALYETDESAALAAALCGNYLEMPELTALNGSVIYNNNKLYRFFRDRRGNE